MASDHRLEIRVYLVFKMPALLAIRLCPRFPLLVHSVEGFTVKSAHRSHTDNPFLGRWDDDIGCISVIAPFVVFPA